MGHPPHFQGRPSPPQAQGQTGAQNPPRPALQPRVATPPQGPTPVVPPPPIYWPGAAPHALQRKVAGPGQQQGAQASPAVPPVYYPHQPQPAPTAVQTRSALPPAVAQLACNCHKPGNKHKSNCPANPNQKRSKAKKVKVVHQETQSTRNLYSYDTNWANAQRITDEMVKDFVAAKGVIHGHATSRADKNTKPHENTNRDIQRFHVWYKANAQYY